MMPQLIKSEVIKKEVLESGEHDHMSEKSDDSSDSGRLQMDISSQEDTEEYRNLPVLKPIGRDTPESNFSDEHAFESADHLWQALAQHSQCKHNTKSSGQVLTHSVLVNGGNEATQLLRKMINCRSLGIPFSPQMHLPTTLDQPMALLKVNFQRSHPPSQLLNSFLLERPKADRPPKTTMPESLRLAGRHRQEDRRRIVASHSRFRRDTRHLRQPLVDRLR